MQPIKTSHGIAILGTCFLLSLIFINWAGKQIDSIALYIPAGSQTASVAEFDSNLVAHYTFDDTANDSAGSNNGTVVGGATYVDGKVGKAMQFDGADDYVNTGNSTMLDSATQATWSFWIKPGASSVNFILSKYDGNFGIQSWAIRMNGNNNLNFYLNGSIFAYVNSSILTLDKWNYVTYVYDGSQSTNATKFKLYVNGIGKTLTYQSTIPTSISVAARTVKIGAESYSGTARNYFLGSLDDVRIYNRALSANEVTQLYTLSDNIGTLTSAKNCESFTYSEWSLCTNSSQTRTINSSLPTGCTDGSSITTQSCTTTPHTYTLTVNNGGDGIVTGGSINCGTTCTQSDITEGTTITLTAIPNDNYTTSWSGCIPNGNTCTVVVNENTGVTTMFNKSQILSNILIPADRLPLPGTWESAGVEGGIPNRQTICADVTKAPYNADNTGATSAVSAIQRAINDCPNEQVVYVPPGRYLIDSHAWNSKIALRKPITLRGAGATTIFQVTAGGGAISIGGMGPWPPPKVQTNYNMAVLGGAIQGSHTVTVADASSIEIGKMIMVDEIDDPLLVWTKNGSVGRYRASMHMVESKTSNSVTFRPALPIDYTRSPQLSRYPDITQNVGVENIKFVGNGTNPARFIDINSAWNVWITGNEFYNMPSKTIVAGWTGHLEIRKNYLHDQSNGGPNSEGIDLANDVNWSAVVDNIAVAAGYPQINIGDMGANSYYSGGFGNVIAYNYAVDSYYTDPPTSKDHYVMTTDIGTNHSPHTQYNLVEGNIVGKFGSDGYHGSGSHSVFLRNIATGRNRWVNAVYRTAIQIDRRNIFYSLIGNVFGEVGSPTINEYDTVNWSGSTIYRLGFPNVGNASFSGTYPPTPIANKDGGPRDLYVYRNNTSSGTTIIEGNWDSFSNKQDWTITPQLIPNSYFLSSKPSWFGSLSWPPVDPTHPVTNDPTIIPAGYRYVHGTEVPGVTNDTNPTTYAPSDLNRDGRVNTDDLKLLTGDWNKTNSQYDLNKDGIVNSLDYVIMVQGWTG